MINNCQKIEQFSHHHSKETIHIHLTFQTTLGNNQIHQKRKQLVTLKWFAITGAVVGITLLIEMNKRTANIILEFINLVASKDFGQKVGHVVD
jgi:hypothetical protein